MITAGGASTAADIDDHRAAQPSVAHTTADNADDDDYRMPSDDYRMPSRAAA